MITNHPFAFDPTYGYDEAALLSIQSPAHPADFEGFWRATYDETRATPLNITRRQIASPNILTDIYEVEFDGLHGARIGAWLTVPKQQFSRGTVVSHGYGGREAPDLNLPGPPGAAIFPCARGFHRSRASGIPDNSAQHVLYGIESRETYLHRYCVADLWTAASVLLELVPQINQLHYMGVSFGGGMGALTLPWDSRFSKAYLDVPSFGNHPLRVTLPCQGSGEAVRLRYQTHPEIMDVLQYFDAASAARFIQIPTLAACALFDPAVPPPGQFSVYNNLPSSRSLFVRPAGHFEYRGQEKVERELRKQLTAWFGELY